MFEAIGPRRRTVAVVLVALLTVLAGCNGGGGDATTTTVPADTSTTTATSTTADRTTTTNATTTTTTAGDVGGQTLDEAALKKTLNATLADASSYTATLSATVEQPNQTAYIEDVMRIDRAAGRNLSRSNITSIQRDDSGDATATTILTETYTTPEVTYQRMTYRTQGMNNTRYQKATPPYDGSSFGVQPVTGQRVKEQFASALDGVGNVSWTQAGTTTVDGATVTRYEASGVENFRGMIDGSYENVSSVNATLLVDENGLVREYSLSMTGTTQQGEEVTLTVTYSLSAVGSTSVQAPPWLETAKEETNTTTTTSALAPVAPAA